jgi:hypothetical protein
MGQLDVLGLSEAADVLDVHKVTVVRMVNDGRLKPDARLACGPVFRRVTVDRFAKKRE